MKLSMRTVSQTGLQEGDSRATSARPTVKNRDDGRVGAQYEKPGAKTGIRIQNINAGPDLGRARCLRARTEWY